MSVVQPSLAAPRILTCTTTPGTYGAYGSGSLLQVLKQNANGTTDVLFLRTKVGPIAIGKAKAGHYMIRLRPETIPDDIQERFAAARRDHEAAAARALAATPGPIRQGDRIEFTHAGHLLTGTATRINRRTVSVAGDDGRDWRVSHDAVRPSTAPRPADIPPDQIMAGWSLGRIRYGLMGREGSSWEQPLLRHGRPAGTLRSMGDGAAVDVLALPEIAKAFIAAGAAWRQAHSASDGCEGYSLWADWETSHRPRGIPAATYLARLYAPAQAG
jgi:hypothetical protein